MLCELFCSATVSGAASWVLRVRVVAHLGRQVEVEIEPWYSVPAVFATVICWEDSLVMFPSASKARR